MRIQLKPIQLSDDGKVPTHIQLLRTGDWEKSRKNLRVDRDTISKLKENFDKKVRRYDDGKLPIDYFHNSEGFAAGWIKQLAVKENGEELWADVEWSKEAEDKLADKQLRYISVDFHFDYVDDETQIAYGPTLFGAGLTNRPFVKEMKPITFDEKNKGKQMDDTLKELKDLKAAFEALKTEKDTAAGRVAELEKELGETKARHESEKLLAEKTSKFNKLMSEGTVVEAQRESYLSGDMEKFISLSQKTNMKASGSGQEPNAVVLEGKTAGEQVANLAAKKLAGKKFSIDELRKATNEVLSENPELAKKYGEETSRHAARA